MQIDFNNKTYTLDLEEITVFEQRVIQKFSGLTLRSLEGALGEGDVDALVCLYWLMLHQSGEDHNIENIDFKPLKFAQAIAEATEKAEKAAELKKAKPGKS